MPDAPGVVPVAPDAPPAPPGAALPEELDGAEPEPARAGADVVDTLGVVTDGTVPAGVATEGVDTDGADTAGAGPGTGTVTAGGLGTETVGTGGGVGSAGVGTGSAGAVGTGGVCTAGTAGNCAAASPVIEVKSTPTSNHQRRCTIFASPVPVNRGFPLRQLPNVGPREPSGWMRAPLSPRRRGKRGPRDPGG